MNQPAHAYWSDQELLEKYRKDRNTEWLGLLLERYFHLIFGVCMKYLKNEEDAKDHTQQICLNMLHIIHREHITYFKSWLYQVTKNHCLMYLRKTKNRTAPLHPGLAHTLSEQTSAEFEINNKQQLLDKEKQYAHLEHAIALLNEEQKRCIELFYFQKKTYQGIAQATGYSLMQVKSHIQNGKRNLRLSIERMIKENKEKNDQHIS